MNYIVTEIDGNNRKVIFETTSRTEAIAEAKQNCCITKKITGFLHEHGTCIYEYKNLKERYCLENERLDGIARGKKERAIKELLSLKPMFGKHENKMIDKAINSNDLFYMKAIKKEILK